MQNINQEFSNSKKGYNSVKIHDILTGLGK
jgi:hypothetical protein